MRDTACSLPCNPNPLHRTPLSDTQTADTGCERRDSVVQGRLNPRHLKAELQRYCMRAFSWLLTLLFLVGCKESTQPQNAPSEAV